MGAYVPAEQTEHALWPVFGFAVPGAQFGHALTSEFEYVVAAQSEHAVEPAAAYEPNGQSEHGAPPTEYCPALHETQYGEPDEYTPVVPSAHV